MPPKKTLHPVLPFILCGCLSLATCVAEIIINEIHYNSEPNTAANEFVEIHNSGPETIDLSGWFFSRGINFTFEEGTKIDSGGYLVIAQRTSALQEDFGVTALGPFTANLAGDQDTLELKRSDGSIADRVSYSSSFPWPVGAGGTGASMELINPGLDNDLGGSWRSSTVPGKLSRLTLLAESHPEWRWRPGSSEASSPVDKWRASDFTEDETWTKGAMPIGYGTVNNLPLNTTISDMRRNYTSVFLRNTFRIEPGEIPQELLLRYTVDDGMIVWINGFEVHRFNVASGTLPASATASTSGSEGTWRDQSLTGAPGYLVEGNNTIAIQLFNVSSTSSDLGLDIELIRPASGDNQPALPTPGKRNSVYSSNAPPIARQVNHFPKQPEAGVDTVISAKITDSNGMESVTLEYQRVIAGSYIPALLAKPTSQLNANPNAPRATNPAYSDPGNWIKLPMRDDGNGGDETGGDNIFSVTIPGQENRTLIRYRIVAEDSSGMSVRLPYNDDPALNFAYFVYNGVPDYVAQTRSVLGAPHTYPAKTITSIPVYHIITSPSDFDQAVAYNGADQISRGNYDARSAYNWNCTFVYDGEVYDNIGYRLRQRNARYSGSGKRSFKFRFNRGKYPHFRDMEGNKYPTQWKYLATHKMRGSRGNYTWGLEQAANHILWNMTGTPAPFTHWMHLRVIRGAEEAPEGQNGQYLGDYYGMLLALEEFDVRFLDAHNLKKGNLYKLISGRTDGVSVRRYLARDGVDDGSDFRNIIFQLQPGKDDAWLNRHVNYDSWNHYHAIVDAVRHYDVQPNTSEHLKNRAFYFEPSTETNLGRLWVLPWDSDTSWGPNWNGGEGFCKQAIFDTNPPRPDFVRDYRNVVREIRDLIWTEEQISLLLDPLVSRIADLVPADRDRWTAAVGGSQSEPPIESVVADMKKFAFVGGSWVGGDNGSMESIARDSGISGQQGRDAYLDALGADPAIPRTPSISYIGTEGFPQGGLSFQSSSFSDPQGNGTFGAMEWRIAEMNPEGGGTLNILQAGAPWKYLDDGSDQGTAWRQADYDDSAWQTGNTPAGYGGITGTVLATIIDYGPNPSDKYPTTYFRKTVNIVDPELIQQFVFRMHVDDGAIVYVNGQEVLRDGFTDGLAVNYRSYASRNGNEGVFDNFNIDPDTFVAGENIIGVELHNRSAGSSDLGFDMSISAENRLLPRGDKVKFEWQANWESGELADFKPDIEPPATAVRVGSTYRSRVRHMDNTGRWSHWSQPLEFTVSEPTISPWVEALVVSEIMYHPSPPTAAELAANPDLESSDLEWIEVFNAGDTALDLTDIRFTKGIEFNFIDGSRSSISPGEHIVIVANEAAFNLRYAHSSTPEFVAGEFSKNLGNEGERIKLSYGAGTPVRDFEFDDKLPWPEAADGAGPSLVLVAPSTIPDHSNALNWRSSANPGGSPGKGNSTFFSGDPNADDNSNGMPNLAEYAIGEEVTAGVSMIESTGYLTLSFRRNLAADDVMVFIEYSSDLVTWRDESGAFVTENEMIGNDGTSLVTLRHSVPFNQATPRGFHRIRVEKR
ncbi:MAG: lamin tail domain-containing protein [Verrucomicrobiales bacterium]|nr:lamin tail domain-containing protein [Verrucomicrobiales bacterium]